MSAIVLTGVGFSVHDVSSVARDMREMKIAPAVIECLGRARSVLDGAAASGQRIYGLNTGLGANLGTNVEGDASAFQRQLIDGRSGAVGDPLPTDKVRAIMAARAAMLAVGGSGISPEILVALVAAINAEVHPVMPSLGSIGAGDLVLMTALARMLVGEGEAEHRGRLMQAAEALPAAGLSPVRLAPKDGLSLINTSAGSAGQGALAIADARAAFLQQQQAAALAMEALRANLGILDPRVQFARPAFGQEQAASGLRDLLAGVERHAPAAVQDALSTRCVPSIHGALLAAIDNAAAAVEIELNAAADNPLVIAEDGVVMSTGNFHTAGLALAFETLGLAIAQAAHASAGRFIQLTGSGRSGLPKYLSPVGGASAGFVPLQKTVTAILAAIRHRANPVMPGSPARLGGRRGPRAQAPLAVAKCAEMTGLWLRLIAFELMAAAQAVDLREAPALGRGTSAVHAAVRAIAAPLHEDRPLGPDADAIYVALSNGKWQA